MGPREEMHRLVVGGSRWKAIPCKIAPDGEAQAVFDIAGVPQIMRALGQGGDLNAPDLATTGMTAGQTLKNVKRNRDQAVVCRIAHPISAAGAKVAGMTRLVFRRPARVLDREQECFRAVESRADSDGEAAVGGPVGLVCDGETTAIDPEQDIHDLEVSEAELARGHKAWPIPIKAAPCGNTPTTGGGRARRQQSGSYMLCG